MTDAKDTVVDPVAAPAFDAFYERRDEVVRAVRGLSDVAATLGTTSLKERVDRELVRKLEEDRFHLVVVGEFNHGKTTFVNALLGEQALPVGVTPTTATIHHIRWADKPEATVVTTSGERRSVPFAEAKRFAVGGGASGDDVDYLEIGYPAALLKERILLVDTPGVNDLSDPQGERARLPERQAAQGVARQDRLRHHQVGPAVGRRAA